MTRPLLKMSQSIYFWPISEYKKVLQWVIDVSQARKYQPLHSAVNSN